MTGTRPPAGADALRGTALKRWHRQMRRAATRRRLAFVLEHVAYPVNVGSMFRIADACRAEHVALAGTTPDPLGSPTIGKVGRGKHARVPWRRYATAVEAIEALRDAGYWVAAVEITADAAPYHTVAYPDAVALVLGNEEHGVTRAALAACDAHVFVPMLGKGASLNVHVAAAVVAYRALFEDARGQSRRPSTPST